MVTGSAAGDAKVWDVHTGAWVTTLLTGANRINALKVVGARLIFVGYTSHLCNCSTAYACLVYIHFINANFQYW
jgi:hypothetical protein